VFIRHNLENFTLLSVDFSGYVNGLMRKSCCM
jgi:hypothetical protein